LIKNILITGATGFLGTNLIKKLVDNKNFNIHGLVNKNIKKYPNKKNIKYIKADITNSKELLKIKKNYDYIINFAGNIDHKNKIQTYNAHFKGLRNLLNVVNTKKLSLFIQIGSSLEYGRKKSPHYENTKCKPVSYYGKAKLKSTQLIQKKLKNFIILRPYQVYGPNQKKNRLIPIIVNACLKDRSFACTDGNQYRDFLYVDDFSELIFKAIKTKKKIKRGIYNIGFGKPLKVKSIINLIIKKTKKGKPLFGKLKMRKEELKVSYPKIHKIKKIFNWKPKIDIKSGLNKTIKFYAK
jgi:nucleoside-diphosphate-sugar epimerase